MHRIFRINLDILEIKDIEIDSYYITLILMLHITFVLMLHMYFICFFIQFIVSVEIDNKPNRHTTFICACMLSCLQSTQNLKNYV